VTSPSRARGAVLSAVAVLAVPLTACTAEDPGGPGGVAGGTSAAPASTGPAAAPADRPFGPRCGALSTDGPGSLAGMATVPVVTAVSRNPEFSALVRSVAAANLVDALNSQQDVTVLAPADEAFEAVPADQLDALTKDVPRLTAVLTHHVVSGRLGPAELTGQHTTADNDTVTVEGSGESFTVPGEQTLSGRPATVLCGNLRTANATVYVIDQVLRPQDAG
jgi:uncharacterized surface protein with fasciclin (FAS1) repeats